MVPEPRELEAGRDVLSPSRASILSTTFPRDYLQAPSSAVDISPDYQWRLRVHRLESDLKFAAFAMVVVPAGGQIGEMTKGLMQ
jgi:hypothetical protein